MWPLILNLFCLKFAIYFVSFYAKNYNTNLILRKILKNKSPDWAFFKQLCVFNI
ncbi:hypothetical protein AFAEFNGA_00377 [Mycoplasmopsis arginini]|nr:hypothetical protein [Mycoplasmopsis arginini]MDI3351111.1 hypothetical protein [Mycoplasmopsis arginini]